MGKLVNPGNHYEQSLNSCNDKSSLEEPRNIDPPPKECEDSPPSQKYIYETDSWLEGACRGNVGIGAEALCDPMQTGAIVNDVKNENAQRNIIYRYTKSIRGCDEGTTDLFRNVVVIDTNGKASPVPIMWASQERAVAAILQDSVRKDNSLVIDRVRLPMMAILQKNVQFNQDRFIYHRALDYMRGPDGRPGFTASEKYERDTVFGVARGVPVDISYELTAWTLYIEDMNQIVEQIMLKFSPMAYIRVRGVNWEIGVKLDSTANNLDPEPGEQRRVVKFQFNLTAESYIPQPIVRKKAVLEERINFFNTTKEEELTEVIDRLEIAVRELE